MKKYVRTLLQSTMILSALGIFVQASAQPVVVREIPVDSKNFFTGGDYVYFTSGDALWRTDGTSPGTFFLTSGINQSSQWYVDRNSEVFNGAFFFLNNSSRELWVSDGSPGGTRVLKTSPDNIVILDATTEYLYFRASDPLTGAELYRTNGTAEGTQLVRDINPGSANSNPHDGAAVGSDLFFIANDGVHGRELWKSDGTSEGTVLIKDINPGPADAVSGGTFGLGEVFAYDSKFYFSAGTAETGREPWVSDGTEAGTMLLKEIMPGPESPFRIVYKIQHDGAVYILTDAVQDPYETGEKFDELWKTSGTEASTIKLATIGEDDGVDNFFCVFKDEVHFVVYEGTTTTTLWKSDGTPGGTKSYFSYYTVSSGTTFFRPVKDEYILFYALSDGFPTSLYRTDGTTEGTTVLRDFNSSAYLIYPREMTKVGDFVFFADHDGLSDRGYGGFPYAPEDYFHLFQTDGEKVESMRTMYGISTVGTNNVTDYNGNVIFTTHDDQSKTPESNPKRLWIYEPMEAPGDSATFTLVNADSDKDVRRVTEGANIVQPSYSQVPLNIRYNPVTPPGSVVFKVNGVTVRTETAPPYSVGGDVNGDYSSWANSATSGRYELTATSYSGAGGSGTPGETLTVTFTIENKGDPDPQECTASGTIFREYWDRVSGNNVSSIPVNTPPTNTSQLTIFEGPTNAGTNYGSRISGYICPPTTGSYTFWIASNDNSELWLSIDDNPANKQKIASVTGATNPREWNKYASQKSAAITLTAGGKYYIEALHKQGAGTDNIAVGWQIPGGTMERPIPGNRLSPFKTGSGSTPVISLVTPTHGQTFTAPADILIEAEASDPNGANVKVEFFAGPKGQAPTKIGEDQTEPYTFLWEDVQAGDYDIQANVTDADGNMISDMVTVTVYASNICSATGTISRDYWGNVSGDRVSDVPVNSPPTSTNELTIFEGPSNIGTNYATRIRGYICPPVTGNFNFWIASNDHSELWLSTDDDPSNKVLIAWVSGATNPQQWNKFGSQRSTARRLIQGQRYYVEALHKQGVGTDHIAVGWTLPDGTLERPIPGSRLSPFGSSQAAMAARERQQSAWSQISVYPNPAQTSDRLMISGYKGINETIKTRVEIISMTGDVVFSETVSCGAGCDSYLMKMNKQLVPGLYLVNMETNGVRNSKRLLIK